MALLILARSEERFSRNAETDLVCRLLLEKKNNAAYLHRVAAEVLFFLNDTATTEIYTLSLHDALPIYLVHQQTQNQRYGSSHIGATAKDISNVVTDAASGVVDIFHGIDKAVAD